MTTEEVLTNRKAGGKAPQSSSIRYRYPRQADFQGQLYLSRQRVRADDQESDSLTAGKTITTFTAPFGKIGLGICYDIVRPPSFPIYHADRIAIPRTRHDRCSTGYIISLLKINRQLTCRMLRHDLPICIQLYHRPNALASPPASSVWPSPSQVSRLISSAVDNQMFVAMCSVARNPEASYQAVSLTLRGLS